MPKKQKQQNTESSERPPIIVVMGHVDHGKSTLLDYIRQSNIVEGEAGGITQHMYAYEIIHDSGGTPKKITFLDTPGHEAFTLMRSRGAALADIAILVVAADDGVKAQTIEAIKIIKESKIPYVVAINKIDVPGAQIEKTKQQLAENDVFLEGYGGDIPSVAISAKSGDGIPELIDLMLLVAELEEFKGEVNKSAEGFVLESHRDPKVGVSATLLIHNGTLKKGMYIAAGGAISPVRRIGDFLDEPIDTATFSSPIRITGFNTIPKVGSSFSSFTLKKEAEKYISSTPKEEVVKETVSPEIEDGGKETLVIPIIIKADMEGTLEAVEHEIAKLEIENIKVQILDKAVGAISESDIKRASGAQNPIILGFNISIEKNSAQLAKQLDITVQTFTIIYRLVEWLEEELTKRRPKIKVEETLGRAKIIRIFSKTKDKQVLGGKVKEGKIAEGAQVKILRRDFEIGTGKILELQQQKVKTQEVSEGLEFGAMIEAKYEIAEGDYIEAFIITEK